MDSENYSEIELTQEEQAAILKQAIENKRQKQRTRDYWDKVNAEPKVPIFEHNEFKELMLARYKDIVKERSPQSEFSLTGFMADLFYNLCDYFNLQQSKFDSRRGILLYGGIGTGKSTLMEVFITNPLQSYFIKSCRDIAYDYSKEGKDVIDRYSEGYRPPVFNPFLQRNSGICFDDLGTETLKKFFGNESNVMADILLNRYDRIPFTQNFITTNLNANQIADFYGDRLKSRFREMFNLIEFPNSLTDLRK